MDAAALTLPSGRPDRRRAGLRLSQRPARRRQFDRDHRLDPRAAPAICGGLGGILQLHRLPVLRPACRQYGRHRHRRCRRRRRARRLRRADGRDHLATCHLGARHSSSSLACADRRTGRRRHRKGRRRGHRLAGVVKTTAAIVLSPAWASARAVSDAAGVLAVHALDAVRGRPHLPPLQFVSASLYSLGHGGNDAQKTMGIIAVLLYSQGHLGSRLLCAVLGGDRLSDRDGARHADRRLAHRAARWARRSRG